MAQTILYYPTINIQDSAWLRNAVLYWDEVSSIVPYEDYPNFSPEVLFLQRSGVYKAVYPQKLFSSEFAEDFCNSIVKRIAAYEARTVNNENTNSRVRVHKNKVYAPALHELIHYIESCRILGYSRTYIAVRHILPNLSDVLLSRFLLGVNSCIMMESTLSFLGLGDLYRPTWETMVNFAYKRGAFLRGAYQYLLAPGVCVMLLCLAFYLISLWLTARKETILEG